MKTVAQVLLAPEAGAEILMGNTVLVRAMLQAGVRVVTSYPGSPTPEIADAISSLPADQNPLYFEFSTNEKVATEVAFGASINGHLSCVFFKSVGLNVAADTFVQLGHMELIGGMVIILGDDPGANSSQNEQDNPHYARLSYIPVLEPANPQEAYDYFLEAARISQEKRMPIILRMTTHVCHAKEQVRYHALPTRHTVDNTPRFNPDNGPYLPITSMVFPLKRRALEKVSQVAKESEGASYHQEISHGENNPLGIITAGLPYASVLDAIHGLDHNKPDILKLGMVYPLPRDKIVRFLNSHKEVKILEELDDYLEQSIKAMAFDQQVKTKLIGKETVEDWLGEYTPDKVGDILGRCWPTLFPEAATSSPTPGVQGAHAGGVAAPPLPNQYPIQVPVRPAQMCPGCGHRSAFHAVKEALASTNSITVADIGCHSLGILEPYRMGQVLLCMGHVAGTAAGLALFNQDRPVVGFIGDSTFYHAGLPGIINAVYNHHRFTLVVMENGTTAMTGHQDHPGTGMNSREAADKIPIRSILQSFGIHQIQEVDAYQQSKLTEMVRTSLEQDGLSVIIAKHPCMLKQTRLMRRKGRSLPPPVRVGEQCNKQLVCIERFACPTYQVMDDGAIVVEPDLCIGDGSCRQTCPSHAIVTTSPAPAPAPAPEKPNEK